MDLFIFTLFSILISSPLVFVGSEFIDELLTEQNRLRATHNAPALQLDEELNRKADAIAKQAAKNGGFQKDNKTSLQNTNTEMICASFEQKENDFVKPKDIAQAW